MGFRRPAVRLVQHFADGEFQAVAAVYIANHRKVRAIGRPVGIKDIFENFTGGAAGKWDARECALRSTAQKNG